MPALCGLLLALLACDTRRAVAQEFSKLGKSVVVPIGQTRQLQMSTKKEIARVVTSKEGVVAIRTIPGDPFTITLIGQLPDVIRLDLIDTDGKKESYEVIVQLDVEYLRSQLRRAVPTANIIPIPFSVNGVMLTGNVARAEDVDVIVRVAQAIGGLQIINALRVGGVQQVQLCCVIAQVSRNDFRTMAFNFLADSPTHFIGSTVGNAVAQPVTVGNGGAFSVFPAILGTPGAPNGQPTNILYGIINSHHGFLAFLQALRTEGVSKDLAQPSQTTLSGTAGSFLVGGEQAVPVPAGLGQVGIQFEEFGTRLNYLPIVLGNGKIHLELEAEVSSLSAANGTNINGTVVPGRVTTRTHATVELESGQSFVIAGLIQHDVQGTTAKIPVIGDLPFVGAAFSSKSFNEIEQEVVILVTPHLVDPQDCSQVTHCLPGEETRRPDDFELFLEGILEAPRGPRKVFQDHCYVPAYKNGPSADLFPCAGCNGANGANGAGNGCGSRGCTAAPASGKPPAPPVTQPAQGPAGRPMTPAADGAPEPPAPPAPPTETDLRPTPLPPGVGEK
jgi:pilus assembly protein CpaC